MNARPLRRSAQRGVVAVELALVLLFVLLLLLPGTLFFGRLFYQYNASQKAIHNATRYLAAVPLVDISNAAPWQVAMQGTRDLLNGAAMQSGFQLELVSLDGSYCVPLCGNKKRPLTVSLFAQVVLRDDLLFELSRDWLRDTQITLDARPTVPYAN